MSHEFGDFIIKGKCNTETNEEQDGTDVFMSFVRPIISCAFDVISCCSLTVAFLACSNAKEMRNDMVIIGKFGQLYEEFPAMCHSGS